MFILRIIVKSGWRILCLAVVVFYCCGHSFQTGFYDASRHGQVQPDEAFGISHEEGIAAFQKDAGIVGEEF